MATKKKGDVVDVINPFTDKFWDVWNLWKQYKKEQFNFRYKGVISEQSALYNLYTISLENEETAIKIIWQSINAGWRGLFELKNNNNNGHSKAPTREDVNAEFASRSYANRKH